MSQSIPVLLGKGKGEEPRKQTGMLQQPCERVDVTVDLRIRVSKSPKLYQDVWSRPCMKIAAELEQKITSLQAEARAREEEIEELVGASPF